jgi:hypothetical protein
MVFYIYSLTTQTTDHLSFLLCLNENENKFVEKELISEERNTMRLVIFLGSGSGNIDWKYQETVNIISCCTNHENARLKRMTNNIYPANNAIKSIIIAMKQHKITKVKKQIYLHDYLDINHIMMNRFYNNIKLVNIMLPKKTFIDREIKKIDNKLLPERNLFDFLRGLSYSKNHKTIIEAELPIKTDYNENLFVSTNMNIIVFYVEFIRHFEYLKIMGAISISTYQYVFVGTNGAHPFLISDKFEYYNSDGSGPDFPTCDIDVYTQINWMEKFFNEFVSDEYH